MSIITFGTGYNAAAAYGFTAAATLPFNGYTILVDTNSLQVLELPLQVAPIAAQWTYTVPNITALAGLTIKTQGLMLGTNFALTNAMDLVVGN